mmetsp:Transcript_2726/g.7585  ORF Transcript_2726/g.7585 Transcript_2726/m.7585 type:complete len:178 (-) Transcript_2726:179-712(-)
MSSSQLPRLMAAHGTKWLSPSAWFRMETAATPKCFRQLCSIMTPPSKVPASKDAKRMKIAQTTSNGARKRTSRQDPDMKRTASALPTPRRANEGLKAGVCVQACDADADCPTNTYSPYWCRPTQQGTTGTCVKYRSNGNMCDPPNTADAWLERRCKPSDECKGYLDRDGNVAFYSCE